MSLIVTIEIFAVKPVISKYIWKHFKVIETVFSTNLLFDFLNNTEQIRTFPRL